nr:uncharacterized protein LOC131784512 [Pocillopora verrucosa]
MKSYLFIYFFAATLLATQGHYASRDFYNDEVHEALERIPDEPKLPSFEEKLIDARMVQEDSHNMSCDCASECNKLNVSRLPHDVRDEDKYLSYENYPVLCRDAAAIYLPRPPLANEPAKKYVCKQVFDCCRSCNHYFYTCINDSNNEYGLCMRGAYKCMCDCIDNKSFNELPHMP